MAIETTLIILKPDCITKGLAGKVIARFEGKGFKIVAAKMVQLHDALLDEHYAHLKDKPFFQDLKEFMKSAPAIVMALEREDAVSVAREMCGPTDSKKASKGTIRGDYGEDVQVNVIHASDSSETAQKEVERFFRKDEIFA